MFYNYTSSFPGEGMSMNGSEGGLFNETTIPNNNASEDDVMAEINAALFPFKYYQWIFIVTFCIIFVVGTGGNFLVIYSVWRCKELKSVTNLFLVNLAVADFMVILTCLPANLVYENLLSWFLGDIMCKIIVYVQVRLFFIILQMIMPDSQHKYVMN